MSIVNPAQQTTMPLCQIAELTGRPLDWVVQEADMKSLRPSEISSLMIKTGHGVVPLEYSTNQSCGGAVIVRADIQVVPAKLLGTKTQDAFCAYLDDGHPIAHSLQTGPTRLLAAMRCYAVSRLGPSVEVPNWILNPEPRAAATA